MVETQENILDLIANGSQLDLKNTSKYAAILGESPSKGAKSPTLWNKAFKALDISACMHPMDVPVDRLKNVILTLRNDHRYIGGAVTMPYKISLLPLLDSLEPEAAAIGAVNCIYRNGDKLVGANTDGAGAVESLKIAMGSKVSLTGKTAAILGTGGAGSAVATYMSGAVGPKGKVILANRTRSSADRLAARLQDRASIEIADLPLKPSFLAEASIIINCTAIGFENLRQDERGSYSLRPYTSLGPVDSSIRVPVGSDALQRYMLAARQSIETNWTATLSSFAHVKDAWIFDIVYQPRQTLLLSMAECFGLPTLNGVGMNLEQAVIAFRKAVSASRLTIATDAEDIRSQMRQVW